MNRVSLEPIITSVAMSIRERSASAKVVSVMCSSSRPIARAKATGVEPALTSRKSENAS